MVSEPRWVFPINRNILSYILEKYQENIFNYHVCNSKGIILFLFGYKHACVYMHMYVLHSVCSIIKHQKVLLEFLVFFLKQL